MAYARGVPGIAFGLGQSVLWNAPFAEAFHRAVAVEIRGCSTHRVMEACESYGIEPPTLERPVERWS